MLRWIVGLAAVALCVTNPRAEAVLAGEPRIIEIPNGIGQLRAYVWTPVGRGPFPAVLFNHGRSDTPQQYNPRQTITEAARIIGPIFARHGYVLLFPFRHGEGLSSTAGPFIGDQLTQEESARGIDARRRLHVALLTTSHLDDEMAALRIMKRLPRVDANRIAVIGHSFGGNLALLEAARDPSVRAVVTFGAGAGSWESSDVLRSLLLATVGEIVAPVMLVHSMNDYSLAPGRALCAERMRLSKPCLLKTYPAVGQSSSEGHNFLFVDTELWQADVFQFLEQSLQH